MVETLFGVGLAVACFVAYNVGGATTGPAFGPAIGAEVLSKTAAAGLMTVFFVAGAWTYGRRVVDTLGTGLVHDPNVFTLEASVIILFFIGGALLLGNLTGVPASTSMTAVGSIAGFGLAVGQLNLPVMAEILVWWLLGPVIAFWVAVMIGRYVYPHLDRWIAIDRAGDRVMTVKRRGPIPYPGIADQATRREAIGAGIVVGIGCLMAFSSGTSNIANAIAPLVGSGQLAMNPGILVGSTAVALGAFTIARRTMETLGNDITDLPLTAALVVAVVSSVIVIVLSRIGIPASFVVIATSAIIGLGWGRTTRTVTLPDVVRGEGLYVSVGGLAMDDPSRVGPTQSAPAEGAVAPIGEESEAAVPGTAELFDPAATGRVVVMQSLVPVLATVAAYLTFLWIGRL